MIILTSPPPLSPASGGDLGAKVGLQMSSAGGG
jgi:hypothetical protein